MRVLFYGAKGWIGGRFAALLRAHDHEILPAESRADDPAGIEDEIRRQRPTHVVCMIGRTHGTIDGHEIGTIDYLEYPGRLVENVRDNLFSPVILALAAKRFDVHVTYLGTGCIFDSRERRFTEADDPNFYGSSYSVVKGFTDRLMRQLDNVLNARIRMPITAEEHPRNFITKILRYEKICSMENSMSVLPELLPILARMMGERRIGTINLTNPGVISHNEILGMYREIVDPSLTWQNFSLAEQDAVLKSGRSNNHLDTSLLEAYEPAVLPIREAVRKALHAYKDTIRGTLLVTGGCGFIGSGFLNRFFPNRGRLEKVVNVDAMYYCADHKRVDPSIRVHQDYVFRVANLCDSAAVRDIIQEYQPSHVIHFAAQSHVQNSFIDSLSYTHDNVLGTHVLLESCRLYGKIQKFIHVSTDEVYGESMISVDEEHKTEHSILCPTNPYAATKAAAELIAQSYHHSFRFPVIITRGNNVYGPGQYPEKLIPRFIDLLRDGQRVTIQGTGSAVRSFLYITDVAEAFMIILDKGRIGEIYNIGSREERSVLEVARLLIRKIINTEKWEDWIEYIEDRPFNDQRYYISSEKLRALGWEPVVGFEEGIDRVLG
ncbi:NAD-dependent epimerase/dehydratase family protein [bacterium]|nr:NAD-dependent epimerase/dehydratase family protein [bacterium]